MHDKGAEAAERFIGKRKGSAASELSTSPSFLIERCELLGVDRPHATAEQDYRQHACMDPAAGQRRRTRLCSRDRAGCARCVCSTAEARHKALALAAGSTWSMWAPATWYRTRPW